MDPDTGSQPTRVWQNPKRLSAPLAFPQWGHLRRQEIKQQTIGNILSKLVYTYTLIYPFTGLATNHTPENGLCHLRAMECPKVYINFPQVVALLFYTNKYLFTVNKHYKWIPTVYTYTVSHIHTRYRVSKRNTWSLLFQLTIKSSLNIRHFISSSSSSQCSNIFIVKSCVF